MNAMKLSESLHAVENLLSALEDQRTHLNREIAVLAEKRALLSRLLILEKGEGGTSILKDQNELTEVERFEDSVVRVLQNAQKPLHISEIRAELNAASIAIPGKGADVNIIARISRDARIARATGRRGYYMLAKRVK